MRLLDKLLFNSVHHHKKKYHSYYDKTIFQHIWIILQYEILMVISMGLAYPWAFVLKYKSLYHHKVICGKRLKFIGNPFELLKHWIWWWFLSVITFGFYSVIAKLKVEEWVTANTIFEDWQEQEVLSENQCSQFRPFHHHSLVSVQKTKSWSIPECEKI